MANAENMTFDGQTDTISENAVKEPDRYRVLLYNDDFTTMDFVVTVLQSIFHKDFNEAKAIMETVHYTGIGQCGVYTQEVAETKVHLVRHEARLAGFPLNCGMEKI